MSWQLEVLKKERGTTFQGELPSISEYFHRSCQLYPQRIAFSYHGAEKELLSYQEVEKEVSLIAAYLQSLGIQKGDRVAFAGSNSIDWALLYLSVLELGAIAVPLDARLSAERFLHLVNFAKAKLFIVDALYEKLEAQFPSKKLLRLSGKQGMRAEAKRLELFVKTKQLPGCDDIAAILFTSGTTGQEKAAILTHHNFVLNTLQVTHPDFFDVYPEDRFYLLLPMHHVYPMTGVFLEAIFHGSEIVFPQGLALPLILDDLDKGQVSVLMSVPLFYNKVLRGVWKRIAERGKLVYALMRFLALIGKNKPPLARKFFGSLLKKLHFDNIRVMISGGGPLANETVDGFHQFGLCFIQGYGMTETSPILTLNVAKDFRLGSVGKALPLMELKIDQADVSGIGEVIVKGGNVFQGYWQNEQATQEIFDEYGWLHTGDIGYLDKDGYLFLTGRKKLMIVTTGGKNIFPEEIENYFQLVAEIAHVVVRSYQEAKFDSPLEILIYPDEQAGEKSQDALEKLLRDKIKEVNRQLRSYERIYRFWLMSEEAPLSSTAKVKRSLIPKELENAILCKV